MGAGSCERSKTIRIVVELVVNVLSTGLLVASDATARLLASPTRAEVDAAHACGAWVDIGSHVVGSEI